MTSVIWRAGYAPRSRFQSSNYELLGRFQTDEKVHSVRFPEFAPEVGEILAE